MKCLLWLLCPALRGAPRAADCYTDPDQQTKITFGARSHWAQPWRAYLETMPATTFLNGTGINYSSQGDPDMRIQHLARHGFAHVRLEVGWGNVSFQDEAKLTTQTASGPSCGPARSGTSGP